LLPLRAKAARFAGLDARDLVQALLIRYDPGAARDFAWRTRNDAIPQTPCLRF
jgi:hypothetical protein